MDIFTAIQGRRSSRKFRNSPVDRDMIDKLISAAAAAPSPANSQPWEFIVIRNSAVREKIYSEGIRCRQFLFEKSGWKWLNRYDLEFVRDVPLIIAVAGDPKKTGADMFMEGGNQAWIAACSAAIQNMLLAAHAMDLGTLWFTMFDKKNMREILGLQDGKDPLACIMIGRKESEEAPTPRKELKDLVRFID